MPGGTCLGFHRCLVWFLRVFLRVGKGKGWKKLGHGKSEGLGFRVSVCVGKPPMSHILAQDPPCIARKDRLGNQSFNGEASGERIFGKKKSEVRDSQGWIRVRKGKRCNMLRIEDGKVVI